MSRLSQPIKAVRILGALGIIGGITLFYFRIFSVNNVTVALSFLLAVLAISTRWGLIEGLVASVASMLCFNYFFIPPSERSRLRTRRTGWLFRPL